jgi:hypothetical protein
MSGTTSRRSGPVDDADALLPRRQTGFEERDHDVVSLGVAAVQTANVIAQLRLEAIDAQSEAS